MLNKNRLPHIDLLLEAQAHLNRRRTVGIICIFFWSRIGSLGAAIIKEVCTTLPLPLIVAEALPCAPFTSALHSIAAPQSPLPCYRPSLQSRPKLGWKPKPLLSVLHRKAWRVFVCVVLPLGWVTSTPTPSISSLLLPTLLFICLWARHVPEPALISIQHNTVYLLRYRQKGREVRMKERVGKKEKETEKAGKRKRGREGWEQEESEKWFRESKSYETLS